MTKIYEALQLAEEKVVISREKANLSLVKSDTENNPVFDRLMNALASKINIFENKVVQFIGLDHDYEFSQFITNYANYISKKYGKSIALILIQKETQVGRHIGLNGNGKDFMNRVNVYPVEQSIPRIVDSLQEYSVNHDMVIICHEEESENELNININGYVDGIVVIAKYANTRIDKLNRIKDIAKDKLIGIIINDKKKVIPKIFNKYI